MSKKIKIVTHSGGFRADDVFGVATLRLLLGADNTEVARTRDDAVIAGGEYVLDVGFEYDPERNRFDHHQEGGAGTRDNGIPYASFGLVWKKFGLELCGSEEVADDLDQRMVAALDSPDNGVGLCSPLVAGVEAYTVSQSMFAFEPTWGESRSNDEGFWEALAWAETLLAREIIYSRGRVEAFRLIRETYEHAPDKRIIVFDDKNYWDRRLIQEEFQKYPDVMYFLRFASEVGWQIICAVDDVHTFLNRKKFPSAWAGKHGSELAAAAGVADALFCHNNAWICVANSKEGALQMAKLALTN